MNGTKAIIRSNLWLRDTQANSQRYTLRDSARFLSVSVSSARSKRDLPTPLDIAKANPNLSKALDLFESNQISESLEIALKEYKNELLISNPEKSFALSRLDDESSRPAFSFLSQLLASLGPKHPQTVRTLSHMRATVGDEATPFKPRIIQKQHGGYPVRLNNGKWTWQGPHWSRHNNRTWKTGYSSDFTYGYGK